MNQCAYKQQETQGTIANIVFVLLILYACSSFHVFGSIHIELLHLAVFASLIAAVDPVAVNFRQRLSVLEDRMCRCLPSLGWTFVGCLASSFPFWIKWMNIPIWNEV